MKWKERGANTNRVRRRTLSIAAYDFNNTLSHSVRTFPHLSHSTQVELLLPVVCPKMDPSSRSKSLFGTGRQGPPMLVSMGLGETERSSSFPRLPFFFFLAALREARPSLPSASSEAPLAAPPLESSLLAAAAGEEDDEEEAFPPLRSNQICLRAAWTK